MKGIRRSVGISIAWILLSATSANAATELVDFSIASGAWTHTAIAPYGLPAKPSLFGSLTVNTQNHSISNLNYVTGSRSWSATDLLPKSGFYNSGSPAQSALELLFSQGAIGNTLTNVVSTNSNVATINDGLGKFTFCSNCVSITSISFPGVTAANIMQNAVDVKVSGHNISATFNPGQSLTLTEAAEALGYVGFNWQQRITSFPDPFPFLFASDPTSKVPQGVSDPPPGGWQYQPGFNAYPFYYSNTYQPTYASAYIVNHESNGGRTLNFLDDPGDPCLTIAGLVYPGCHGEVAPLFSALYFETFLVGVKSDGNPSAPLYVFSWKSDFNGLFGGIAKLNDDTPPDPGGTGGVTLLSQRLLVGVPEPSTWLILLLGMGILGSHLRRARISTSV